MFHSCDFSQTGDGGEGTADWGKIKLSSEVYSPIREGSRKKVAGLLDFVQITPPRGPPSPNLDNLYNLYIILYILFMQMPTISLNHLQC